MEYKVWTTCPIIGLMLLLLLVNSLAAAQTQSTERIDAGPTTSPGPPTPTIPKLPLAIHYEALCPDSKNFVRLRLYDALADNDWWPRTELKLYPFGKANVSVQHIIRVYNILNCTVILPSFTITPKPESWKCSVNMKNESAN